MVFNGCMATLKSNILPIFLVNTNKFNVWVRQPLLKAELYDADYYQLEYGATKDWEGDEIKIEF